MQYYDYLCDNYSYNIIYRYAQYFSVEIEWNKCMLFLQRSYMIIITAGYFPTIGLEKLEIRIIWQANILLDTKKKKSVHSI